MGLNPDFWAGKRVFLTGHTGFKGSWLSLLLNALGAEVHGYALAPATTPSMFDVANVSKYLTSSVIADVRDAATLEAAVTDVSPDVVIHMAAQAFVGEGYKDPVLTYETNVMGCVHLFEALRSHAKTMAVVNVTSDKCYENREWPWPYRETEPMGGHDPYSNSKGCAELVSAAYRNSYFADGSVRLATARAGNVIGGGDWSKGRLVPDVLQAFDAQEELVLRSPGAVRPWQHVLEPLSGYLTLAAHLTQSDTFCEGWNFGPSENDVKTVGWVVERLSRNLDYDLGFKVDAPPFHEATLLKLDSSQARTRLEWAAKWGIGDALQKTAEWHAAWKDGKAMDKVSLVQIQTYLNGAG